MSDTSHVTPLLPDYLTGSLSADERSRIDSHLGVCDECRKEFEDLGELWQSLATLPEEKPGQMLRQRFYDMLDAYEHGLSQGRARGSVTPRWWRLPEWSTRLVPQAAFALLILVAGLVAGYTLGDGKSDVRPPDSELAGLREEVRAMSTLLTVSLLQQHSATERLRGVSLSGQQSEPDPEVISALVRALKTDPNVNVRLASLDALSRLSHHEPVRHELLDALPRQHSPLVEIALVDLMVRIRETGSLTTFRQMLQDPDLDASVRKRLEEGLQQLS